jgi:integrase
LQKVFENLKNIDEEDALVVKIALYAGMRLNEILQLTVADIKKEDDIYYFDINNKNNKQVKNKSSIRKVPIHSILIDEILEYKKDKSNNLFTKTSKQYSKWYRIHFNRKYITKDSEKVFHSFRHNFVNALIQRDVKGEHIAQLVGHSQELHMTMSIYGNAINLMLLKNTIENIEY